MSRRWTDRRGQSELRAQLEHELRGEVLFDSYSRALYSTDASNHQITPLGVVLPRHEEDLFAVVEIAAQHGIPLLPRGGGTSLSGAAVGEALILDCSAYLAQIHRIDADSQVAEVGPGVVCGQLNAAAAQQGLMYGPDPASADRATFGGMIGTNATGAHSIRYGMTADHVTALEVVLADGSAARLEDISIGLANQKAAMVGLEGNIYAKTLSVRSAYSKAVEQNWPRTWRRSSGYSLNYLTGYTPDRPAAWYQEPGAYPPPTEFNLAPLVCGSEGTLAIVRRAEVRLVPKPKHTALVVLSFDSAADACEYTPSILESEPAAVELLPRTLIERARAVPAYSRKLGFMEGDPEALLVIEYTGDTREAAIAAAGQLGQKSKIRRFVDRSPTVFDDLRGSLLSEPGDQADLWAVRKAGLGLLMSVPGDAKPLTFMEDVSVPVPELSRYVREVDRLLEQHGTHGEWYAHASAGCLHMRPLINLKSAEGVQQMRAIADAVVGLAIELRGSISGEHGDGLSHTEYNERLFGSELMRGFHEIKGAFDPQGILNPGKVVELEQHRTALDIDLRYGPEYRTVEPETAFAFHKEGGFSAAVEACTGVGICRKPEGVMCPSFQATRLETHSTRGRANALRSAISGALPDDALTSHEMYEILDLCLECKGCKSECPTEVDMARLKAEFLGMYQAKHGVPLRSRVFAEIAALFRIGQLFAPLANAFVSARSIRWLLSVVLGIAPQRTLPILSSKGFGRAFSERSSEIRRSISDDPRRRSANLRNGSSSGRERVVLFVDTYTEFNNPDIGLAAARLLEAAGCDVSLVEGQVCCGRPMISKGLLKRAKENAMRNVQALAPHVRSGAIVVGLEPSCILTLRDEYLDFLPGDLDAIAVAGSARLIEEFLTEGDHLKRLQFQPAAEKLVVHNHCHTKTLVGSGPTLAMLRATGMEVNEIPSGCCGMAGSFGYEAEHYELSTQIGELKLFPAIRAVEKSARVVAPGMSCRAQIRHGTGVDVSHPVQLMANLLVSGPTESRSR